MKSDNHDFISAFSVNYSHSRVTIISVHCLQGLMRAIHVMEHVSNSERFICAALRQQLRNLVFHKFASLDLNTNALCIFHDARGRI